MRHPPPIALASYLSLSNAIGPAIGGALVSWGYRVPFWVTGVLTLMTAAFALQLRSPQSTPAKSS
ncbi:MAG: hypothetical protein AAFX40_09140 [Cyanobacteria bacterium J06639_1]